MTIIRSHLIFITTIVAIIRMNVSAFSGNNAPKKKMWWHEYKENLRKEGAMDVPRSIKIKAERIKTGNDSITTTSQGYDDDDDDIIETQIVHFQDTDRDITICFPIIQDSPLTQKGRHEATLQRSKASALKPGVVVVSPLHRAIQTALISFRDQYNDGIPFVAHEGCREQLGLLMCNKALPLSQTKIDFPKIDFDLVTHGEEDHLWNPYKREGPVDEANRAYEFMTGFLMERPEKEISVVCHSAWLFSLCNAVMDCNGDEELESWFDTGEIRSMKITYRATAAAKL